MKELFFVGAILLSVPLISFAQTTATGTGATQSTPSAIADPGLIPGDFFYFLDRWGEAINTAFTFNKEKKAQLHLQYAKERVAEMKEVLKKPDAKLADIADAKANFDTQIADAASLVKDEKDKGVDVVGLARDLSDELDASRGELKNIFQEHQSNAGQAEAEIRAKIEALNSSGVASSTNANELQGLTQALESITKEKGDATKEENDLDVSLLSKQALLEEAMGPQMTAEKHKKKVMRGDSEMNISGVDMSNASGTEINIDGAGIGESHVNNLEQEIKKGEDMMEGLGAGKVDNETNSTDR